MLQNIGTWKTEVKEKHNWVFLGDIIPYNTEGTSRDAQIMSL